MIRIPGKIPITIQPLFWLLAIFIGWMSTYSLGGTLLALIVIVVSVLFHEFGHALTASAFGQKVRVELAAFGGFTYREGRKLKLSEEFLVVLNGPLAGFLLFLIAYLVLNFVPIVNPSLAFLVKFTTLVNLFWTIVNLIPVLPLDGGHLLSIILEAIFGFKGVRWAIIIGLVVAVAVSIVFFVMGAFLVGALFLLLTFESFRSLRYYKLLKEHDRDTALQDSMRDAEKDFKEGHEKEALEKFQKVREKTKEGVLYTLATEETAEILKHEGRYKEAYELLLPVQKALSHETAVLFHFLAFQNRDYETVIRLSKECYQNKPSYEVALFNALAFATKRDVDAALGWLHCARRDGLPSVQEALTRPEFDPIRTDKRFLEITHS